MQRLLPVGSGPAKNGRTGAAGGTRKDTSILTTLKEVPSAKTSQRANPRDRTSPKAPPRPGQRSRKRAPNRSRPPRDVPILPLAIGGIFLAIFIGLLIWYRVQTGNGASTALNAGNPVANIQCQNGEQLAVHYHAHVDILWKNQPVTIPANTGIPSGGNCLYWLHTHDESGVIHIEAPQGSANRQFTLGNFFQVWGQPLSKKQVATIPVGSGDQLKVWVNGTPYAGDPSKIVLKEHEQIVLEIGPPFAEPPPAFTWPANL